MISIDVQFDLPATPGEVFAILGDPRRDPEWQKSCAEVVLDAPDEPIGTGTSYRYVMQMMGRRMEFHNRLTTYDRPGRVGYEVVSGPASFVGAYTIEASSSGDGTTVRWTFGVDKGTGFALMPDSLLRKAVTKQSEKDQKTLADLLLARRRPATPTGDVHE